MDQSLDSTQVAPDLPITVDVCVHVQYVRSTHLQEFGCEERVWIWPGSWDDSTIKYLCSFASPQQREGAGCSVFVFVSEGPTQKVHRFSSPSSCLYLWSKAVQGLPDRNVSSISQECMKMLDSFLHFLQHKQRETHKRVLLTQRCYSKPWWVSKHLHATASVLLGNFSRQTTTFAMINDAKWSKAVLEWDEQFFSAWKQQSLTPTKSEQSRRRRDRC